MFKQILNVTFGMLLLRTGPQEMPARREAMLLVVVVYLVVGLSSCLMLGFTMAESLAEVLWGISMLWLFVWSVLKISRKPARIPQTFSALLACNTVFEVFKFPPATQAVPWIRSIQESVQEIGFEAAAALHPPPGGAFTLILMILFWSICVMTFAFRHALETSYAQAALIACMYPVVFTTLSLIFAGGGG